jgi:DNA-directed RNA polymerase subunit RPC12/RpoP
VEGDERKKHPPVFDACPHCGRKLSPWQQVLLSVDRALMCRNCWYRIILDAEEESRESPDSGNEKPTTDR